jgi:pyruvate/2-oxoglutarate dehydrogenase complex dihydrolipoamide acyltransferase (E2) component
VGDVLLEIETDKAQMDVEAQDSGILAKILVPDGTRNVNVGRTIAILAEEGDDISSLEIPVAESELATTPAPPPPHSKEAREAKTQPSQGPSIDQQTSHSLEGSYPPSVSRLLQEYRVENPKVIEPTGPHGRLLKGDVLAYVGSIQSDFPKTLKEILAKKQTLDLGNIVPQKTPDTPQPEPQPSMPSQAATPPPSPYIDVVIRLTELIKLRQQLSG